MMNDISYVVVSTPRSGTGYTHKVLSHLGLNCTHEGHFSADFQRTAKERYHIRTHGIGLCGDSSWFAAPFLSYLRPKVVILHQIRDPLKSVNSIARLSHIFKTWTPKERTAVWLRHSSKRFIFNHTMRWGWPEWPDDWTGRAMHFWYHWHRQIEKHSQGRRYFRYRLEDLGVDLLEEITKHIWFGRRGEAPGKCQISKALGSVSKKYNTRNQASKDIPVIKASDLTPQVLELAEEYGYKL